MHGRFRRRRAEARVSCSGCADEGAQLSAEASRLSLARPPPWKERRCKRIRRCGAQGIEGVTRGPASPRHPQRALILAGRSRRLYGDPRRHAGATRRQVGSDECLLNDSGAHGGAHRGPRAARRSSKLGAHARLAVWAPVMPEARQAIARIGAFVQDKCG